MTTREAGWITGSGLTKRFGRITAVDGLTFTAAPGAVTGFLGPNGAGKTTTLRMLAGLVVPDAGAATISGHAYSRLAAPGREAGVVLEAALPAPPGRCPRRRTSPAQPDTLIALLVDNEHTPLMPLIAARVTVRIGTWPVPGPQADPRRTRPGQQGGGT